MFKIKTLNKISNKGLDIINNNNYKISDDEVSPDGILVRSADMLNLEFNDNLQCIARAGAGVNNIPLDRCSENGIVVFNTPGANANAVKELVICGLLLGSRKIAEGIQWVTTVEDTTNIHKLVEKEKSRFVGGEIYGKKLGVIGLGAIGVLVANSCNALGMDVIGYDPYISVDSAWSLSRGVTKSTDINEIFESCDYISLHLPLLDSTKEIVNSDVLKKCKDGVVILNFSRGELVNTSDIINSVNEGKVGRYITDFPKNELVNVPNIINIPHLGASTPEAEDNCAYMAVAQMKDYLENGNIVNSVNFPVCSMPFSTNTRLCIINKNMPKVVSKITSLLGDESVNIENMINKSRGDNAYTMIDIGEEISDKILKEIEAIEGIVNVRVITKGGK